MTKDKNLEQNLKKVYRLLNSMYPEPEKIEEFLAIELGRQVTARLYSEGKYLDSIIIEPNADEDGYLYTVNMADNTYSKEGE